MKKSIITIMAVVYGVFSLGLNLHLHYCGGRLAEIDLFHSPQSDCEHKTSGCCDSKDCCSFQDIHVSIDQDHSPSFLNLSFYPVVIEEPLHYGKEINVTHNLKEDIIESDQRRPPDLELFIKYHSLTYYG